MTSVVWYAALVWALSLRTQLLLDAIGPRGSPPLWDMFHHTLPDLSPLESMADTLVLALAGAYLLLLLLAARAVPGPVVAKRLVFGLALRAILAQVTVLPSPARSTHAGGGRCGGVLSGRTFAALVFADAICKSTTAFRLRPFLSAYVVWVSVLMVATRLHYTADVLVAWMAFALARGVE
jgi:hypothetical protein